MESSVACLQTLDKVSGLYWHLELLEQWCWCSLVSDFFWTSLMWVRLSLKCVIFDSEVVDSSLEGPAHLPYCLKCRLDVDIAVVDVGAEDGYYARSIVFESAPAVLIGSSVSDLLVLCFEPLVASL
ncbi:hypothetical protein WICPIJ_002309 [Wickerhamomyces pijperi]|uniref:Uncharacterized protein n=1 Tax=Wickerhamomyces pijperi TaxID=599730 RepID=A0A9P8Q985_WICPI|nr:hypothetical protein WICPIJ_002309 [Wickerhamomyces pijperi]